LLIAGSILPGGRGRGLRLLGLMLPHLAATASFFRLPSQKREIMDFRLVTKAIGFTLNSTVELGLPRMDTDESEFWSSTHWVKCGQHSDAFLIRDDGEILAGSALF
jgi:hypothetical protein